MSRRSTSPLVLRDFQQEAVDGVAAALIDTAGEFRAAPSRRTEITRLNGCFLLEAPTASGKTVMLAVAAERASAEQPVVWFWWAPFKGVVDQTAAALRSAAPGLRVRDPRTDRTLLGTREGDVFIATWASSPRATPKAAACGRTTTCSLALIGCRRPRGRLPHRCGCR